MHQTHPSVTDTRITKTTPESRWNGLSARTRRRAGEEGTILIVVMVTAIAMFGLVFTGTLQLQAYKNKAEATFRMGSQARNVARAGLIDAFSWFRRQPIQPVVDFAPVHDANAVPPVLDTDDPSLGLVREFQMSGSIWARYEVRLYDANKPLMTVRDVSALRGYEGAGQAWTLACWGIVFRNADPQKGYSESPNLVLGTAWAFTEIRRITLSPPGDGAICCANANLVNLGKNSKIHGKGKSGVVSQSGNGTPTTDGEIDGLNPYDIITDYDASVEAVFGVSFNELESLADLVVTDPADYPDPFPRNGLVIVKGDMVFDFATPLAGTGVVVVTGDCTLDVTSRNYFSGVLYVMGHFLMKAPSYIRGTIIVGGGVTVTGQGDIAEIEYDPDLIDELVVTMGRYRISKAIRYGSTDTIRDLQIN